MDFFLNVYSGTGWEFVDTWGYFLIALKEEHPFLSSFLEMFAIQIVFLIIKKMLQVY